MKTITILSSLGLLLLLTLGYLDLQQKINKPTAVINMEQMYHAFEMTKTMEKKYKLLSGKKGSIIDSLNTMIQTFQTSKSSQANPVLVNQKVQVAAQLQANILQENETMKLELEQQIWNQLNEYLHQFGQEKKYAVILAAQNHGNIIFADQQVDITEQAIQFINNKYRGIQ